MAIINLKGSEIMTGLDATPMSKARVNQCGGRVRYWSDTVEVTAAASDTSTFLLARLPSNAVILPSSKFHFDDLASTGAPTMDIGIYNRTGKSDFTDDVDALSAGADVTAAGSVSIVTDITKFGKEIWELISGVTVDPVVDVDIKVVLDDADTNTGGTITFELYYTVD